MKNPGQGCWMPSVLNKLRTFILRNKPSTKNTENPKPESGELSAEKLRVFLKYYKG